MSRDPASVGPAPDGLLPCPFCGGPGEQTPHSECPDMIIIGCADEDCAGSMVAYDFVSFETAAAHWNTRAPHPDREAEPTGGVVLKTFPPETEGVQSRYILVHQLRASADIQDGQTKRETGWATTSDRAQLMREAATALEGLAALSVSPPVVEGSSAEGADTQPGSADDWAELEALAKAAMKRAPGLWGSDIEKSEGSYGSGDDDRTGFMVPYMETEHGKRLFDAHYCDVAEIHEDYDSDEHGSHLYAWDEASREIFNFLSAAQPSTILKLIEAARQGHGSSLRDTQPGAEGAVVGWQPIETHDGSRDPVLLWFPDFAPDGVVVGFFRAAIGDCYYPGQWLDDLNNEPFEVGKGEVFPTHWMPLPAAPDTALSDTQVGIPASCRDEPKDRHQPTTPGEQETGQ